MEKVKYGLHIQAIAICPECGELCIEDLGTSPDGDGIEMTCPKCGTDFMLQEVMP